MLHIVNKNKYRKKIGDTRLSESDKRIRKKTSTIKPWRLTHVGKPKGVPDFSGIYLESERTKDKCFLSQHLENIRDKLPKIEVKKW